MRLPFELAEPGTDPTARPNPHPRHNTIADALPWIVAGVGLLVVGYLLRPVHRMSTARPTPAMPTPTSLPALAMFGATPAAVPTAVPTATPTAVPTATPTAVPTATPTAVPTATPTAVPTVPTVLRYAVFSGGPFDAVQRICECDPATGAVLTSDGLCHVYVPSVCHVKADR